MAAYAMAASHYPVSVPPQTLMALSAQDVQRIATLARIELSDAELPQLLNELNAVFALIGKLQAVDTAGIEPMAHAQSTELRLRPDVVTEPNRRDDYQRVAPAVEAGLYLVPRVIE
jgi:aspartyl-tRNA(Asn)/glutamyl-tRNA(Gln) amidotransferase subunit C